KSDLKNLLMIIEYGLEKIISLNCNENPLGISPKAQAAIVDASVNGFLYPDDSSMDLRIKVAEQMGIDKDMVIFGNGADNILMMLAQAFLNEGDEYLVGDPSFFVYETTSALIGGKLVGVPLKDYTYDLKALKAAITPKTKIVMICNPNNPTGTIVTQDEVDEFMDGIPEHCIVVFDEAYGEFVQDKNYAKSLPYVKEGKNVLIIRTLSKLYGLAGLRVGYAVGPEHLIDVLRRVVEAFPVNRMAQAAALAALDDKDFFDQVLAVTKEGRDYLAKEFNAMGMKSYPSHTNFLFVDLGMDSVEVYNKLLPYGILIRTGNIWNLQNFARITIGTKEQNQKLVAALKAIKG
ncbi:MAG: histidinol-phosphate transaminase, partial [Clostridiales bacterium]